MNNFSIAHTILLIIPYVVIYLIHYFKSKDNFFLRTPSYMKIDLYIWFVSITLSLFLVWNSYFSDYLFLGLKISKETIFFNDKFITFLGISSAIIGWLYTVRTQAVTNMRNHSISTIVNARLSDQYNQKIDQIYEILKTNNTLTFEHYLKLNISEKAVIHYILNYYEFIAVAVKYNELDEDIVKRMMRSQVLKTHATFKEVISELRLESDTLFENFIELDKRWSNN